MAYQHKELAAGRWSSMPFIEQMANIGSEVERALTWQSKDKPDYCRKAFERGLELLDMTLESAKGFARLRELTRIREAMVDYFSGTNQFMSTAALWRRYFSHFTYAVRKNY